MKLNYQLSNLPTRLFFTLVFVLGLAAPAVMADPWVDDGFSTATPNDPVLVIVREGFYGAEGVDLSAYLPDYPDTVYYVQSLYFRFFVDNIPETYNSFTGRMEFPPGIEILGKVDGGVELGGSVNDGIFTETDTLFGPDVGVNPDDYSELHRGFEFGGGLGTSEFVSQVNGTNAIVFGFNVEEGVDDFRVIIDYGDSFPESLSFDIYSYEMGKLGGGALATGFQVGNINTEVIGSGDFSDFGGVEGIPLTSTDAGNGVGPIEFNAFNNLFIARDTDTNTRVDGFDTFWALPSPDLVSFSEPTLLSPVGITDGNDQKIYIVGENWGLGVVDPQTFPADVYALPPLPDKCVDITNLADDSSLYLLREQDIGDSYVDELVVSGESPTYGAHIPIPENLLPSPKAITDGPDGMLYAIGFSNIAVVDAGNESVVEVLTFNPEGGFKDITSRFSDTDYLYLLRTSTGTNPGHFIDRYDITDKTIDDNILDIPLGLVLNPISITDGPDELLYLIGKGTFGSADLIVVDPTPPIPGIVETIYDFLDFPGTNVSITNLDSPVTAVQDDRPLPELATLQHMAAPNPFNPRVKISYELVVDSQVRVAVYDVQGRLVRSLWSGHQSIGWHDVSWDGRDQSGRSLPSGTYLYRVQAGTLSGSGKLMLAK